MRLDVSLGEEAFNPIQELQKFDKTIYQPLICKDSTESPLDDAKPYILQRWSTVWQEYVNVIITVETGDGDKLLAVPEPKSSESIPRTLRYIH